MDVDYKSYEPVNQIRSELIKRLYKQSAGRGQKVSVNAVELLQNRKNCAMKQDCYYFFYFFYSLRLYITCVLLF